MTASTPFGTFFLPGPTEVRQEVLAAMLRPMIPHRSRAFETVYANVQAGLKIVFRTERTVLVSSSSATGLMEAAVRCAPAGRILSLTDGAFSERFADIARACGRDVDALAVEWGAVPSLDEIERRLAARSYAAVTVAHSETSTGALMHPRAVTELAHRYGAMCLVDSVSGLGGAELEFDAWGLDLVLTGSQKALALPPGIAFLAASESYMESAARQPARGRYFDLVELHAQAVEDQTPATPALPLFYAAEAQMPSVVAEGMERRWARHASMAELTWRWAAEAGERLGVPLGVLAPEGSRSPTVSVIVLPEGVTGPALVAAVAARGVTIAGGYGKLRERTVRIGHMGDHTEEGVARCLDACEDALGELIRRAR